MCNGAERKRQNQYIKQWRVVPSGSQLGHLVPSPMQIRAASSNVIWLDKQSGALLRSAQQELVVQCVRYTFPGPISTNHDLLKSESSATMFPGKARLRLSSTAPRAARAAANWAR
jgi:hypothetical protein